MLDEQWMSAGTPSVSNKGELIFLVGFMGAGKTTVGRVLAEKLSCPFIDLDELIEARTGMRVREIFERRGEAGFRRIEAETMESLPGASRAVVALGGGAFAFERNRAAARRLGVTVWLDCPLAVCIDRAKSDDGRPLLGSPEQMARLLELRRGSYEESDCRVDSGSRAPEELADEIIDLLDSPGLTPGLDQHRLKRR